jgi:hypothetical protein
VRKINGVFDCELEPTGKCQFDDNEIIGPNIRKCPTGKNQKSFFFFYKIELYFVIGTYCDGNRCRPSTISRQMYEKFLDKPLLSSRTTTIRNLLLSTYKQINRRNQTTAFIRILIVIAIAIVLFFILIIFIITIIIKSHHFHVPSTSSEDKVSSSSFAQSTSTAISTDSSTNINYHQQLKQQSISTIPPIDYETYFKKSTFVHGLVPRTNLTPRFHRQQQTLDEKRRIPLQIRSPSLSRINPFIDHASLTTNEHLTKKRAPVPKVTRLQNGDVMISA